MNTCRPNFNQPAPTAAAAPRPHVARVEPVEQWNGDRFFHVVCTCGFRGAPRKTEAGAARPAAAAHRHFTPNR